jgi:hypothetical protein
MSLSDDVSVGCWCEIAFSSMASQVDKLFDCYQVRWISNGIRIHTSSRMFYIVRAPLYRVALSQAASKLAVPNEISHSIQIHVPYRTWLRSFCLGLQDVSGVRMISGRHQERLQSAITDLPIVTVDCGESFGGMDGSRQVQDR